MRQFFKYVLASIVAYILLFLICIIVLIGIGKSMNSKEEIVVKDNSVLKLDFNMVLDDQGAEPGLDFFGSVSPDAPKPTGLNELIATIKNAKNNSKIKGIYMNMSYAGAGYAKLEEIRDALIDFKSSGKFIISYAEYLYENTYYLASVSDKIYLNPSGEFLFNGLSANISFFKHSLEKLGIEVQVIRHGKFKGAVEPYVLDKLSPENRKQINEYINSIYQNLINQIAKSRNISPVDLDNIADKWIAKNPIDAVKYKLIDHLDYEDAVYKKIKEKLGIKNNTDKINFISYQQYKKANPIISKGDDRIAIYYADGEIISGLGEKGQIGSAAFIKQIRKFRDDDKIKAVVLRINSPGGSALASDVMWRELILLKNKKPLIISMADVAASGGYYIASAGDTIVAHPFTVTGSIGVFGMIPNMQNLFNNKLGITSDVVKTGEMSDFGAIDRPLTAAEKDVFQNMIERIYSDFISKVASGRQMQIANVDSIGQGRVWTGEQALKINLVDVMGGLDKAIQIAAWKIKSKNYKVIEYPKQKNQMEQIMESLTGKSAKETAIKSELGPAYQLYSHYQNLLKYEKIQARMPFEIEIR